MNESMLVTSDGEKISFSQLTPALIEQMSVQDLEYIAINAKYFESMFKNITKDVKRRLDSGEHFENISYGQRLKRTVIDDDNDIKQRFIDKYGLDSVKLKSHAELTKKFGEVVVEDLEKVTIEGHVNTIKWK